MVDQARSIQIYVKSPGTYYTFDGANFDKTFTEIKSKTVPELALCHNWHFTLLVSFTNVVHTSIPLQLYSFFYLPTVLANCFKNYCKNCRQNKKFKSNLADDMVETEPATSTAAVAVRGVTFDLDDTLWCGKTVIRKASTAFHAYLAQQAPQLADKFPPATFDALLMEFQRSVPDKAHDYTFLRKYTLRHCVDVCGAQNLHFQDQMQLEEFVDAASRAFLVPRSQPELFDGVESLFQNLELEIKRCGNGNGNGNGSVLGVITNGNCEMDNLPKYFQDHMNFVVSAELVGTPKPNQAIFDAAVAKFSALYSRQHLVHVGDHYECDVEGAKRAGLRTIWVNAKWSKPDALTRNELSKEDAERYAAADAIIKEVNAVLCVVERWNYLAASQNVMPE